MMFSKLRTQCGVFLCDENRIFRLALVLGMIFSLISIFVTSDMYRDVANVYAYYAREIGNGNLADGWVGRVPMLHIILVGALSYSGADPYLACIIVSCMFYLLTLFPLREFVRRFLPPLFAAYGCLLFIIAPKIIRFSVSGLIDPARYFFLIGALLFMLRLIDAPTMRRAVFFGLFAAGEAVSRGEGVILALALLFALPVLAAFKYRNAVSRPIMRYAAVTAVATLMFVAGITPFCIGNYLKHGVFVTDMRLHEQVTALTGRSPSAAASAPKASARKNKDEKKSPMLRFLHVFEQSLRGGYEVYWGLAAIGIIVLLWTRRWQWDFSVLLMIYLLHQVIYYCGGTAYRYSIYLVPMLMPFTMTGVKFISEVYCRLPLQEKWRRFCNIAIFSGALIAVAAFAHNGLSIVFSRDGDSKQAAADFIRRWGANNIPKRRLKIAAAPDLPEIVYWSGAYSVNGYNTPRNWEDCLPVSDLILVDEDNFAKASAMSGLKFIKAFYLDDDETVYLFETSGTAGQM